MYGAPWGLTFAGKFTWSTPIPTNLITCLNDPNVFDNGAPCTAVGYTARNGTGYEALDLQVTKDFTVRDVTSFYLRFDFLNVTNNYNLVDYTSDPAGADGLITSGRLNPTGNITGYPRTVRGSFGVKF